MPDGARHVGHSADKVQQAAAASSAAAGRPSPLARIWRAGRTGKKPGTPDNKD